MTSPIDLGSNATQVDRLIGFFLGLHIRRYLYYFLAAVQQLSKFDTTSFWKSQFLWRTSCPILYQFWSKIRRLCFSWVAHLVVKHSLLKINTLAKSRGAISLRMESPSVINMLYHDVHGFSSWKNIILLTTPRSPWFDPFQFDHPHRGVQVVNDEAEICHSPERTTALLCRG